MAYVVPPTTKKNALSTTTTGAITTGAVTIPISDCSICYDVAGNLITQGYVLRNPNSLTTPPPEEITITGCSVAYGTGGPGNITGVVRAVNYDANTGGVAQGAAYAWPAGTVISAMISIGVYNILVNDIIALSPLAYLQPIGIEYNYTAAQPSPTLRIIDINGNTISNVATVLASNPLFTGIYRCNLNNAGIETAKWGDTGFSYTGSNGQVMTKFPGGYYMQQVLTGGASKIIRRWVCPIAWPGFRPHPAFITNGKQLNQFYIGTFAASVYAVATAATELDTITVTAGCTANGNLTITLDGNYAFTVAVTTASNTAALVAAVIRAAGNKTDYNGVVWTVGGSGATVTYTAGSAGLKTTVTIAVASTGVTASVVKTTAGAGGYVLNDSAGYNLTASTGDLLSSVAGVKPASGWENASLTLTAFRTLAQNRGTGWNLATFQQNSWMALLATIKYGTFYLYNTYPGITTITDDGVTNMTVPNGRTAGVGTGASDLGNTDGQVSIAHYQTSQATYPFNLLGVENFYGNIWMWADGLKINNYVPWVADNGFNDSAVAAPYINMGVTLPSAYADWVTQVANSDLLDFGFLPMVGGGSSSTGLTCYGWTATGLISALFGGGWSYGANCGVACWSLNAPASLGARNIGARLVFFS